MGRTIVCALATLLPGPFQRAALRRLLGWEIGPSARIGLSLFVGVGHVRLGEGARIGHFNVFRNLRRLELGERSSIGQWNWISASKLLLDKSTDPQHGGLVLGRKTAVTARHYIDCSGGVFVGSFSVVAGVRSTILSHQVDFGRSRSFSLPVTIGEYCFVGSNNRITPGSSLSDRCVTAMGAVVAGALDEPETLYAGVPAKPVKKLGQGAFFERLQGSADI
jgi:acetyltransferase-like isoleucine patch superfamily enzyme